MIFWSVFAVAALLIEIATVNLVSVWFVAGAIAAFVAALLGADVGVQAGIFVLVTAILLIFTMPAARRLLQNSRQATNSDRIIGQEALVTEERDSIKGTGQVKVLGNIWSATADGVIPVGSRVEVYAIRGVKAVVKIKEV